MIPRISMEKAENEQTLATRSMAGIRDCFSFRLGSGFALFPREAPSKKGALHGCGAVRVGFARIGARWEPFKYGAADLRF